MKVSSLHWEFTMAGSTVSSKSIRESRPTPFYRASTPNPWAAPSLLSRQASLAALPVAPVAPAHSPHTDALLRWREGVSLRGRSATSAAPSQDLTHGSLAARPALTHDERRACIGSWRTANSGWDNTVPSRHTSSAPGSVSTKATGVGNVDSRVALNDFNAAYRQLNADITREMGGLRGNLARALTVLGTLGSIGGAVAMGLAAPAALTGLLTGVGIPHGFAAAILGAGVGLAGLALSVLTGALVRKLARKSIAGNEQLRSKIITLREIEAHLGGVQKSQRHALDAGDAALLKNTRRLLTKVDPGFATGLRKQAMAALAAPISPFILAVDAMRRHDTRGMGEAGRLARVKKAFFGAGLNANLGSTARTGDTPALIQLESNGVRWLSSLNAQAVPVVDPVGQAAHGFRAQPQQAG